MNEHEITEKYRLGFDAVRHVKAWAFTNKALNEMLVKS
jgi:hypothetical protein